MSPWGDLRSAVAAQEWDRALALAGDSPEALGYVRDQAAHKARTLIHSKVRAAIDARDWHLAILWARESAVARAVVAASAAQLDAEGRLTDVSQGGESLEMGALYQLRSTWHELILLRQTRHWACTALSLADTRLSSLRASWLSYNRDGQWKLEATPSGALERRIEVACEMTGARVSQPFSRASTMILTVTTRHPELWLRLANPKPPYRWVEARENGWPSLVPQEEP